MDIQSKTVDYLKWVRDSDDPDTREMRRLEFHSWYSELPEDQKARAQTALKPEKEVILEKLETLVKRVERELGSHRLTLEQDGRIYEIGEWLTVKEYARKNDYKQSRVINWIHRGIVPDDCIIVFPELGNLRLLKNIVYKEA